MELNHNIYIYVLLLQIAHTSKKKTQKCLNYE